MTHNVSTRQLVQEMFGEIVVEKDASLECGN
jgi:hypothetical protein